MAASLISWFEIYVHDIVRAKAFYEAVFQFTLTKLNNDQNETWAFPDGERGRGVSGALVEMPEIGERKGLGKNAVTIYFFCEDCLVEEKRVIAAGGVVAKSKFSIGNYGFASLVYDSEGTMIGLHSRR